MSNGDWFYKKLVFHPGFNEPIKLKPENLTLKLFLRLVRLSEHVAFNKFNMKAQLSYEVNERIAKVPFVFQNISLPKGSKILDVGCNESKVSIELASLGYEVTGIDFFPYNYFHKNFSFFQGNLLEVPLPLNYFDAVIAISSIEHIGLRYYGPPFPEGDKKAVDKLYELLKEGGMAFFTVPYAQNYRENHFKRVYDEKTLSRLIGRFKLLKEEYYQKVRDEKGRPYWSSLTKQQLAQSINDRVVVCLVCLKE